MLRILLLSILSISTVLFSSAQELERRAFMGILLSAIDEDMRSQAGFKGDDGIFVLRVFDKSSASAADIKADDILISLNDEPIVGVSPFLGMLKQFKTGDKVALEIFREGKIITKDLELKPFPKESNPAFETIYSSVVNGDNHQRIFLTKPFGDGPFPTVMVLQGVGCASSEYPFESMRGMSYEIIDSLTRAGYATIRVERSGMGDNKGQPCLDIDFKTDLGGFRATIAKLGEFSFVDQDALFLMGFSMGGVIAPLLANETDVKGIIAYGTASLNWKDYETENSRRQYPLNFENYESFAENMRLLELLLTEFYNKQKTPEQIADEYPEHAEWITQRLGIYPMHYRYFQQVAELNTLDLWYECNAHVLAVHGSSDYVSSANDHALIAEVVNNKKPGSATYVELEHADHWFNYAETYEESQTAVNSGNAEINRDFIPLILAWLKKLA
ncbi:MAG: alpha/beta fold hydrolase [Bacteroidota bacterium]